MDYKQVLDSLPQTIPFPADYKGIYRQRKVPAIAKPDNFNTVLISRRAGEIWQQYCAIFKQRWDLSEDACYNIGLYGKTLASAEFIEHGDACYSSSVVQPIRNAYYNSGRIDYRWERIGRMGIEEPVLDYGCGVGFLLLWMKRVGFTRLYGHELEGVTKRVATDAGIEWWKPGYKVSTVLCINVLEHLPDPVGTLLYLKNFSPCVIANTNMDRHEDQHIAPEAELTRCTEMLREWGTLYES